MAQAATTTANKVAWVEHSSKDAAAARDFYSKLFGWDIEVIADPQYGGYGMARLAGEDAAGISPAQSPDQPSVWNAYIGTDDVDALAKKVESAGGKVIAPPFDVGDQGRMAIFQDPSGAFVSAWQGARMGGFHRGGPNAFSWAELNARGLDKVKPFYRDVFGWTAKETGEGGQPYTEFQLDGHSVAGALEMQPMVPAEVPSYWMVYFGVEDVDAAYRKALDLGATEMVSPQAFSGGRFAIVNDPVGAMFGLLTLDRPAS